MDLAIHGVKQLPGMARLEVPWLEALVPRLGLEIQCIQHLMHQGRTIDRGLIRYKMYEVCCLSVGVCTKET